MIVSIIATTLPASSTLVTEKSRWSDDVWIFRQTTAGSRVVTLNWSFQMSDGSCFTDPRWATLLSASREFILSVWKTNRRGSKIKSITLDQIFSNIRYLIHWMIGNDYQTFSEIDQSSAKEFCEFVVDDHVNESEESISHQHLANHVDVLNRLFEQGPTLSLASAVISEHPFSGATAHDIAAKLVARVIRSIPAVPDPLYLSVVSTCIEWIDKKSDSIINAASSYYSFNLEVDKSTRSHSHRINSHLKSLGMPFIANVVSESDPAPLKRPRRGESPLRNMRRAICDLREACTITLQALLGLRVSEVAGLSAKGLDLSTGLPSCVEIRPSLSGISEIFYLKGKIYKQQDDFTDVEWVAGSRPAGTKILPDPVRAIVVLERLFRPWRAERGIDDLILSNAAFWQVPKPGKATPRILSDDIREGQQRFVAERVIIPSGFENWRLTTHQWRKAFAQYLVRSDERLLPAVSAHFKHLSIANTEQGYIGHDPEMLGLIDDIATRDAARLLYQALNGNTAIAGKMADIIQENSLSIMALAGDSGSGEDRITRLTDALRDDDVRAWSSPWGTCLFRSEAARCHHHAAGEFNLSARNPNYVHRQPGVCCSCSNLLVVAETHGEFWRNRHRENLRFLQTRMVAGEAAALAVALERSRVSAGILEKLKLGIGGGVPK